MKTKLLYDAGFDMPKWLPEGVQYETLMGSISYGANVSEKADTDIYGWAFPPEGLMFPHRFGYVSGFTKNLPKFNQFQKTAMNLDDDEYDVSIYGVARYFRLCADGNPNMIDSMFTGKVFHTYTSEIGQHVLDNRNAFLSKSVATKCLGFARGEWSRLKKTGNSSRSGKRPELVEKHGFDTKAAYHTYRLLSQAKQLLTENTIHVYDENRSEELKKIRLGFYTLEELTLQIEALFVHIELLLDNSNMIRHADEEAVTRLLYSVLDAHYGRIY